MSASILFPFCSKRAVRIRSRLLEAITRGGGIGYDLHITRRADWCDKGNDITLDELLAVIGGDPELKQRSDTKLWLKQGSRTIEDPSLTIWTAWSRQAEGEMALFHLWNGNIEVKNPDDEIRRKMSCIAQLLKARVQGDDGEFYNKAGDGAYEVPSAFQRARQSLARLLWIR